MGRQTLNSFLPLSDQFCLDCDTVEDWNPTQGFHKGEMNLLLKAKVNCIKIIDKIDDEYRTSFILSVMS